MENKGYFSKVCYAYSSHGCVWAEYRVVSDDKESNLLLGKWCRKAKALVFVVFLLSSAQIIPMSM